MPPMVRTGAREGSAPAEDPRRDDAPRVVLVTAPDRATASALARALVEARVAACVNVVGDVTSVYRWQDAVQEEAEVLLIVKSTAGRLPELERLLAERHPYDVPECVALAPDRVEAKYLQWLRAETGAGPRA